MTQSKEQKEGYIRALLEERRGYVQKGDEDGVKDVDAELKRLGAAAEPPAKRAATREEPKAEVSPTKAEVPPATSKWQRPEGKGS